MFGKIKSQKSIWSGMLMLILLLVSLSCATTNAPVKKHQVPTNFPFTFGKFQITVLYDGNIPVGKNILFNTTPEEMEAMLARNFIFDEIPSSVNAYLINTGSKLILVDTGAGHTLDFLGPILGHLTESLADAGYKPEQIDAVLVTHCHRDHLGGLLDDKDKPVFSNAIVYVPRIDNDFWLNKENESKYHERYLPYFKLTQKTEPIFSAMGKWKTYEHGSNPMPDVPEIKAIGTPGHTPGLSAFEITSEGKKFVIWGDVVHVASLQMSNPAITIIYDLFPDQAAASRLEILQYVSSNKALTAGMHLPFPGVGHVRDEGQESFTWVPVEYAYKIDKNENIYY